MRNQGLGFIFPKGSSATLKSGLLIDEDGFSWSHIWGFSFVIIWLLQHAHESISPVEYPGCGLQPVLSLILSTIGSQGV